MTDSALLEAFTSLATSLVGDALGRLPAARGLRPFHMPGARTMAGRALTVRTAAGDNLWIHRALEEVRPGQVLVVDGEGYADRALMGEIMVSVAVLRGAHGLALDGAIRDSETIRQRALPCYARAVSLRGPYKNGPGAIGVPVCLGGQVVMPGDLVLGDADGVIVLPWSDAPTVLDAARKRQADEAAILSGIAEGRYHDAYAAQEEK